MFGGDNGVSTAESSPPHRGPWLRGLLVLSATLLLAGCHNFFVCQKASCPSGGGGSTTSDWVYVSNASASANDISAYDIGNGSLAAISGSPYPIGFRSGSHGRLSQQRIPLRRNAARRHQPRHLHVRPSTPPPANTVANGGNALITTQVSSMDISPDGNYLFVVNVAATALTEYSINASGLLALANSLPLPPTLCPLAGTPVTQTCTVKVAPSGQFVVASLGSAGTAIYPYTSTQGITSASPALIGSGSTSTNPTGDYSVTLDKNNYVFIARTAALAVYQITDAAGDATLQSTATFSSTATPRSVTLSNNEGYVYTANEGSGNISGFTIGGTGQLSSITGSPFAGPASVSAIGADKSGSYMVAVGLQRYLRHSALHRRLHWRPDPHHQRRHRNLDLLPRSSCPESLAPPQAPFNPPRIFARTCLLLRLTPLFPAVETHKPVGC